MRSGTSSRTRPSAAATGGLGRSEQKEATRILDAAGRLMENRGLEELSYAAIAAEAGVQERTVYRHFRNRSALLDGLWVWRDKQDEKAATIKVRKPKPLSV